MIVVPAYHLQRDCLDAKDTDISGGGNNNNDGCGGEANAANPKGSEDFRCFS